MNKNKIVVTDPNGNEMLNAEDRKIAMDMLKHEFKRGADTELARVNNILDQVIAHFQDLSSNSKDDLVVEDALVMEKLIIDLKEKINA